MNQCFKIAALVLAMSSLGYVHAEGVNSEYQHQADANKTEITPEITYNMQTNTGRSPSTVKQKITSTPLTVLGEYGLNEMMSLGLQLGYQMQSSKLDGVTPSVADTKSKGLQDPVLKFKSRFAAGPGVLKAGLDLTVGIEKHKVEASGDSNAATGAMTATPFVGYEMAAGPGVFGARFQIDLLKGDRKTDTNGVETTDTGGSEFTLTPFYEWEISKTMTLGGALSYTNSSETSTKTAAGVSTSNKDKSTTIGVEAYLPMTCGESGMVVIPTLGWETTTYNDSKSGIEKGDGLSLAVAARFTF